MASSDNGSGCAETVGGLATVYAEAAEDSGDVIEWRSSGDVRHWHEDDVIQWYDEDSDEMFTADNNIAAPDTVIRDKFETGTDVTTKSDACSRTTDVGNGDSEGTSYHVDVFFEGCNRAKSESHFAVTSRQVVNTCPGPGQTSNTDHSEVAAPETANEAVDSPTTTANSIENATCAAHTTLNPAYSVNATPASDTLNPAHSSWNSSPPDPTPPGSNPTSLDEPDAVHPRLSSGAARRRRAAFVCDTCSRDAPGWHDCVDHAYRSGHGLAARCALCRLPAVRCRRRGRHGVWHRCAVVDTVRKLGTGNVAALVAGSHLTAPRPWRLSCGECGAAFAAKTARLVRHVVERGHAVRRHCEKCLFPVFGFGLNDECREMHVCVGNVGWLRAEEGAFLATAASNETAYNTHSGEAASVGKDAQQRITATPNEIAHQGLHRPLSNGNAAQRSGFNTSNPPPNGSAVHPGELNPTFSNPLPNGSAVHPAGLAAHDYRRNAFKTANESAAGRTIHAHDNGASGGGATSGGERGVMADSDCSAAGEGRRMTPLASVGTDYWQEERSPSCVAI